MIWHIKEKRHAHSSVFIAIQHCIFSFILFRLAVYGDGSSVRADLHSHCSVPDVLSHLLFAGLNESHARCNFVNNRIHFLNYYGEYSS